MSPAITSRIGPHHGIVTNHHDQWVKGSTLASFKIPNAATRRVVNGAANLDHDLSVRHQ